MNRAADTYVKHPNSYLPKYNVNSETDGETTPLNATDINRNSGESNAFESDEELDDQIEEEGWCNFSFSFILGIRPIDATVILFVLFR